MRAPTGVVRESRLGSGGGTRGRVGALQHFWVQQLGVTRGGSERDAGEGGSAEDAASGRRRLQTRQELSYFLPPGLVFFFLKIDAAKAGILLGIKRFPALR